MEILSKETILANQNQNNYEAAKRKIEELTVFNKKLCEENSHFERTIKILIAAGFLNEEKVNKASDLAKSI